MSRRKTRRGRSYARRVLDINAIYDKFVKTGLSNREIWIRYVYPQYGISERTFYNMLKASANPEIGNKASMSEEGVLFSETLFPELFEDYERRDSDYFKKRP